MLHARLSPAQRQRHARHLVLPEIGPEGLARLAGARVLLVGLGGLGAPVADYLARAGVGRLDLLDPDVVAASDLPRGTLYASGDVGRPKAEAARERLREVGAGGVVEAEASAFAPQHGRARVRAVDLVLDASDNPATRYLLSDACVLEGRPLLSGAVVRTDGRVARLAGGSAPCQRCLHPEPPRPEEVGSCADVGILAPAAGAVAGLMATQALRFLAAPPPVPWTGLLLHADLLEGRFVRLEPPQAPDCPACGPRATLRALRLDSVAVRAGEPYPAPVTGDG